VFYVQLKGGVVPEYIIRIKQICETPSDPDDREGALSLGINNIFVKYYYLFDSNAIAPFLFQRESNENHFY
jgi:hypothetical protein